MVKTTVKAGICGFTTVITAQSDDMQSVRFSIETDCDNVRKLAQGLPVVDAYHEVGAGFDGALHTAIKENLRGCCSGCLVPCGIFKAMQVEAGLALPAQASVEIEKPY